MATSDPSPEFTCAHCGRTFSLPQTVLERYPGWNPKQCKDCHGGGRSDGKAARSGTVPSRGARAGSAGARVQSAFNIGSGSLSPGLAASGDLGIHQPEPRVQRMLQTVLATYTAGPRDGVFTDGGCSGNPGPGGWGTVVVHADRIIGQRFGRAPSTTNNRMELSALAAGYEMLPRDAEATVWTDSELCVNIFTKWADGWAARGWRRKGGPIKNLDLIEPLYDLVKAHRKVQLLWVKAHVGYRWNEYVDTLATGHLR